MGRTARDSRVLLSGETAVQLPPAAQLSWNAEITTSGIWGDLLVEQVVTPNTTGRLGAVELGRLTMVADASRRVLLAEALARHADHAATLEEALATMRRYADARLRGGLR